MLNINRSHPHSSYNAVSAITAYIEWKLHLVFSCYPDNNPFLCTLRAQLPNFSSLHFRRYNIYPISKVVNELINVYTT